MKSHMAWTPAWIERLIGLPSVALVFCDVTASGHSESAYAEAVCFIRGASLLCRGNATVGAGPHHVNDPSMLLVLGMICGAAFALVERRVPIRCEEGPSL